MVLDGFRWFSIVFWQVLDGGGGLDKFFGPKNDIFWKNVENVKVLDGGGGLNKFLGVENDI